MLVAASLGMDGDAKYERPCKWLLATGAMINWIAAVLVVLNDQEGEYVSRYAADVVRWLTLSLG